MKGTKPHLTVDPAPVQDLSPPDWLSEDAMAEWNRVIPALTERKILTDADLGGLENYCVAIGTVRETERHLQSHGFVFQTEGGLLKANPAAGIQSKAMATARQLAAELGLTPVSRSRPAIRDEGDDDDLSDVD